VDDEQETLAREVHDEMAGPIKLILCRWCNKMHAVTPGETPCAPGAWFDVDTGSQYRF